MKGRFMNVKIGELARLTNCQVVTIRYYEQQGLMDEPRRSPSGYRLYGLQDVQRLNFIRHCRAHGMALREIKELLRMRQTPDRDCSQVNELVDRHIEEVERRIDALKRLRSHLMNLRQKCPHGGSVASCGILRGLADRSECGCLKNIDEKELDITAFHCDE